MGYFRILTAIPGFFLSALVLMLLWNAIAPDLGLARLGYPIAMAVNITIWLAVAPLVAAGQFHFFGMFGLVPGFFLSSLFLMLLWGAITPRFNIRTIDYPAAMAITITLWIAVGPLAFTTFRFPWSRFHIGRTR
jgi:hypothetical protein